MSDLPEGYKYKAQDADGRWYAYPNKPRVIAHLKIWGHGGTARQIGGGILIPAPDWRNTLKEI